MYKDPGNGSQDGDTVDITKFVNMAFAIAVMVVIAISLASFWQMIEGAAEIRNPRPIPTQASIAGR